LSVTGVMFTLSVCYLSSKAPFLTPVSNPKIFPPKVDIYAIARSFLFTFLGNFSNFIFVASIFSSIAIAPIQFIWFIAYFFRFSDLLNDKERKCFNVMKKWL